MPSLCIFTKKILTHLLVTIHGKPLEGQNTVLFRSCHMQVVHQEFSGTSLDACNVTMHCASD